MPDQPRDTPTHGVHVVQGGVPEGVVPPSTSLTPPAGGGTAPRGLAWFLARTRPSPGPPTRTAGEWNRQSVAAFIANHSPRRPPMPDPKPRIVVWESDVCAGVISGQTCVNCAADDCEHECHDTEPAPEGRTQDVAAELVALIVPIIRRTCPRCKGTRAPIGDDVNCPTCMDFGFIGPVYMPAEAEDYARRILAAVLPEHQRRVREQVAAEIEAERTGPVWDENDFSGDGQRWDMAMEHAARIAREEAR